MLHFAKSDETIKSIMQPHSGNEGPREVCAHFPKDADKLPGSEPSREGFKRGLRQFTCPLCAFVVAHEEGRPTQGVHPFGQIVKILTVPIPLQSFINDLIGTALFQRLADPETAQCRVAASRLLIEAADPALTTLIMAKTAKNQMNLFD